MLRKSHFSPKPEQAILVRDDQPTDFAIHDFVKQALLSLLPVIHARTEIGNYFELPSIGGAERSSTCF